MGNPIIEPDERYTYRHYRTWPETERWELIDGHAWVMTPAPMTRHQALLWRLSSLLYIHLKGKSSVAYPAPFDVLLPRGGEEDDEIDTVVQPDVSVFCDKTRITKRGARGAPDIVMEILSPTTSKKDMNEKFRAYEMHVVREYWILDPAAWSIWVYHLKPDGSFDAGELRDSLGDTSPIASGVLEGFVVEPEELFADLD